MADRRVHLIISGAVQGVFYRYSACEKASGLGLTGFVRNCPDGKVELVAEGEEPRLKELIRWCQKGPPGASVSGVAEKWGNAEKEFSHFSIVR